MAWSARRKERARCAFFSAWQAFSLPGQLVCDPFLGTGTTGMAALQLGRRFVGADVDGDALTLARVRLDGVRDREE